MTAVALEPGIYELTDDEYFGPALASGGTGTDVCRHRSHWLAHWCARRYERAEPIGVWFDVRPVSADA